MTGAVATAAPTASPTAAPATPPVVAPVAMRVEPAVQADHPMVEAHLLQSPDCDLLVLANWSGAARPVVVTLRNGVAYARAEAVRATDAKLDGPSGSRAVSLTLGPGDFVRLFR